VVLLQENEQQHRAIAPIAVIIPLALSRSSGSASALGALSGAIQAVLPCPAPGYGRVAAVGGVQPNAVSRNSF